MQYNTTIFDKLCDKSKVFARVTGVKLKQFHEIVRKMRLQWKKFQKKKKVSRRSSKIKNLGGCDLIDLNLLSVLYEFSIFGNVV